MVDETIFGPDLCFTTEFGVLRHLDSDTEVPSSRIDLDLSVSSNSITTKAL
jgi:hypothetical protein